MLQGCQEALVVFYYYGTLDVTEMPLSHACIANDALTLAMMIGMNHCRCSVLGVHNNWSHPRSFRVYCLA